MKKFKYEFEMFIKVQCVLNLICKDNLLLLFHLIVGFGVTIVHIFLKLQIRRMWSSCLSHYCNIVLSLEILCIKERDYEFNQTILFMT